MYLIDQIPFVLCATAVTSVRVICKAFSSNIWIIICDATSLSPTSECSFMGLFHCLQMIFHYTVTLEKEMRKNNVRRKRSRKKAEWQTKNLLLYL